MQHASSTASAEATRNSLSVGVAGGAAGYTFSSASAIASFSESMLIHGTGQGIFEYTIALANYGTGVLLNGNGTLNGKAITVIDRMLTFQQAFTFQAPFDFNVTLGIHNASFSGWSGQAGSLFLNAAVSNIRVLDANGTELHGFRYRAAEAAADLDGIENPEPGAWLLAGTALIVLPWLARRRNRKHSNVEVD